MRPAKRIAVAVAALTALATVAACGSTAANSGSKSTASTSGPASSGNSSTTTASSGDLTIGILVPTSGVYAGIGKNIQQGFDVFLKQKNSEIAGHKVKLVVADGGADPAVGSTAAQRLIQQDKVDAIVGVVSSPVGLAVSKVATQAKVPLIVTCASAVTPATSPYIWRSNLPATGGPVGMIPNAGKYMAESIGDGVFTAASDYAAGHDQIGGFLQVYKGAGAKPAGSIFTPFQTTTDYQPYLAKIKAAHPKAVYVFYAGSEAINFVKQYKQFGVGVPLYGMNTIASRDVITAEGATADGVRMFSEYVSSLDNPVNKAFVADYQAANNDALPSWYAATSYAAGQLIENALATKTSGDLRTQITEGLQSVRKINTPMGVSEFPAGQQSPTDHVYLVEVTSNSGSNAEYKVLKDLGTTH